VKRWMLCLFGLVVIFITGYFVFNNEDGKQREVRIVAEYQAIKHPEGAKLVHYELNRKIINRWIRSRYTYPMSNDEVIIFYNRELTEVGWQKVPSNLKRKDIDFIYVKENMKLLLGLNNDNSWALNIYYMDANY